METKKESKNNHKQTYYRTYEASPIFSFKNTSTILTTKNWIIDFENDDTTSQKYMPFNNVQITNNSDEDIYFYPNQDSTRAKLVPSGTIITFDSKVIPALRSLKIYNASATTVSANEIEVAVWKEGVTVDNAFKNMHKAFFKFLYKNG